MGSSGGGSGSVVNPTLFVGGAEPVTVSGTSLTYSFLYVQLGLCEGEVESISDIMINNLPSNYYDAVAYDVRLGSPAQSMMPQFSSVESTTSVSRKITNGTVVWGSGYQSIATDPTPVYGYVYVDPSDNSKFLHKLGYYTAVVTKND